MKYLLLIFLVIDLFAMSDIELQKLALDNGLKPVPKDFQGLLKTLNVTKKELSKEKIVLGKKLFFEKELSLAKDISCATCHSLEKGGADGIPTAIGHKNRPNPFHLNTPTFLNTAFSKNLFWNGSSKTLAHQAKGPLQAPFEMAITPKLAEERIRSKKEYVDLFQKFFRSEEVTFSKIAEAIASFEKTVVTRGRYDEFLEGDLNALNKTEKEGLELFITKSCIGCHNGVALGGQDLRKFPMVHHNIWSMKTLEEVKNLEKKYANFLEKIDGLKEYFNLEFKDSRSRLEFLKSEISTEDIQLLKEGFFHQLPKEKSLEVMTEKGCIQCHNKQTYQVDKKIIKELGFPFKNRGGFTGSENQYFRVSLLRNVVRTAPYFHNGEVKKLEDAIKIMAKHQHRTIIEDGEVEKIISFLKAVDGKVYSYSNE